MQATATTERAASSSYPKRQVASSHSSSTDDLEGHTPEVEPTTGDGGSGSGAQVGYQNYKESTKRGMSEIRARTAIELERLQNEENELRRLLNKIEQKTVAPQFLEDFEEQERENSTKRAPTMRERLGLRSLISELRHGGASSLEEAYNREKLVRMADRNKSPAARAADEVDHQRRADLQEQSYNGAASTMEKSILNRTRPLSATIRGIKRSALTSRPLSATVLRHSNSGVSTTQVPGGTSTGKQQSDDDTNRRSVHFETGRDSSFSSAVTPQRSQKPPSSSHHHSSSPTSIQDINRVWMPPELRAELDRERRAYHQEQEALRQRMLVLQRRGVFTGANQQQQQQQLMEASARHSKSMIRGQSFFETYSKPQLLLQARDEQGERGDSKNTTSSYSDHGEKKPFQCYERPNSAKMFLQRKLQAQAASVESENMDDVLAADAKNADKKQRIGGAKANYAWALKQQQSSLETLKTQDQQYQRLLRHADEHKELVKKSMATVIEFSQDKNPPPPPFDRK